MSIVPYISGDIDDAWDDDPFSYEKSKTGFVGLSNQGATCYMNSLLQTLYMTPEFRSALYKWKYDRDRYGPEESCIPYQLQKLFARLQMGSRGSIETTALTKSFGWDASESFQQHDVQELCRVLLDALDHVFKKTTLSGVITDLYEGTMVDYIQCKHCEFARERKDKYQDIPLVIRGMKSIDQSLEAFITPELLNEDNQYSCEPCATKRDALKGLRFESDFPRILTLQLKRFDFDYDTLQRVKLNDEVSFPLYLDMSKYLRTKFDPAAVPAPTAAADIMNQFDDKTPSPKAYGSDDDFPGLPKAGTTVPVDEDFPPLPKPGTSTAVDDEHDGKVPEVPADEIPQGDHVYELYSILIHSGSALGGHYYAYIKNFVDNLWYDFNDSSVSKLSAGDIEKTFGGSYRSAYYNMPISRSANAYMLMYRHTKTVGSHEVIPNEAIPADIRAEIEADNAKFSKANDEYQKHKDDITLKVYYRNTEYQVSINKKETIGALKLATIEKIKATAAPEEVVKWVLNPDLCRMRGFSHYNEVPQEPYDGKEDTSLESHKINGYKTMMLEERKENDTFPAYDPSAMLVRIVKLNQDTLEYEDPIDVYVHREANLRDLKLAMEPKVGYPTEHMRVIEIASLASELIGETASLRTYFRIYDGDKIHVEYMEDSRSPSVIMTKFEETKHVITLRYNAPGTSDAEFPLTVTLDKRNTLGVLRETIAKATGLPVDGFKMRRGHHLAGEFKNVHESLATLCLHDQSSIFLEKGKPCRPDEFKVNILMYKPDSEESMYPLFEMNVSEKILIKDLKAVLAHKTGIPADRMRIRDRFAQRVSKIYLDNRTFKQNVAYVYDGKDLAVQEIPEPEVLQEDDLVLIIQRWYPQRLELGPKEEITVKQHMRHCDFQQLIGSLANISLRNLDMAKPWVQQTLYAENIITMHWDAAAVTDTRPLSTGIWILRDGDHLLYRDGSEVGKASATGTTPTSVARRPLVSYDSRREHALKINVYERAEDKENSGDAAAAPGAEGAAGEADGKGKDEANNKTADASV